MSLVELARYSDSALAHIVKGRLEAEGIEAVCFDTGMNLAEGVPMLFRVRLMVLDEDLDRARRLIAQEPDAAQPSAETDAQTIWTFTHSTAPGRRRRLMLRVLVGFVLLLITWNILLLIAGSN